LCMTCLGVAAKPGVAANIETMPSGIKNFFMVFSC
jgi:hypothetical protein